MVHWAVVVPAERYAAERLFHHDTLELTLDGLDGLEPMGGLDRAGGAPPAHGDDVVLVAAAPAGVVFGLGRVVLVEVPGRDPDDPDDAGAAPDGGALHVSYTRRLLDEPVPADGLADRRPGLYPLDGPAFAALAARAGDPAGAVPPRRAWLVSLDMPIEASTPAEAVRTFWSYAMQLGPRELPAFVAPVGDELAMQAYVLGEPTNLDPEEDD